MACRQLYSLTCRQMKLTFLRRPLSRRRHCRQLNGNYSCSRMAHSQLYSLRCRQMKWTFLRRTAYAYAVIVDNLMAINHTSEWHADNILIDMQTIERNYVGKSMQTSSFSLIQLRRARCRQWREKQPQSVYTQDNLHQHPSPPLLIPFVWEPQVN